MKTKEKLAKSTFLIAGIFLFIPVTLIAYKCNFKESWDGFKVGLRTSTWSDL